MIAKLILLAATTFLISCSAIPEVEEGHPVAILHTKGNVSAKKAGNLSINVLFVDDNKVGTPRSVRLKPGDHTLIFSYSHSQGGFIGINWNGRDKMKVKLRDGGEYRLEGVGNPKGGTVKLVDVNRGEIVKTQKVSYQQPADNGTLLQDLTNQMMVPYHTGVY